MVKIRDRRDRRKQRGRAKIRLVSKRPRLSVFVSGKHIYAQIIDDTQGITLVSASTNEKELRSKFENSRVIAAAEQVGEIIAERALAKGIDLVVFDKGGKKYHGRVKAVAEGARNKKLGL